MHRRLAAAVALGVTLLLAACTQPAPQPPPPPPSGPKMPSDPATSASPSPSPDPEKAIDNAVIKAYRGQFDEYNRLDMQGGTDKPTQKLLKTTSGTHREAVMTALQEDKHDGIHALNAGRLLGVVVKAGAGTTRDVTACEDYTHVIWAKKDGSHLHVEQPILNLQHSIAKRGPDGLWRIDSNSTDHVKSLKSAVCFSGDK